MEQRTRGTSRLWSRGFALAAAKKRNLPLHGTATASPRAAEAGSLLCWPTSAGAPCVRLREQITGFAQTKKQKPGSRRKGCSPGNPFCLKDVEMLYVHVHFY